MNKLKFLGRGSAFNVKEGNTSAYYKKDRTMLLIDCGESIFKTIIEKNILEDVDDLYILITHFHSDHIGSLSSLLMYCYYIKHIKANVYFEDTNLIKDYLLRTGAIDGEVYNIIKSNRIDKLNISFDSYNVYHDSIYKDGNKFIRNFTNNVQFTCYGYFLVFDDNTRIYYSGDSSFIDTDIIHMLEDGWIVYHDTCLAEYYGNIHTSLKSLCERISIELRKNIYCMHIDCDELIDKAKAAGFNVVENI